MLTKYVAGNNRLSAINYGYKLLKKSKIPIINYIEENNNLFDNLFNNETRVYNEYDMLINNDLINSDFMIAIKLSSFNFNKNYIYKIAEKCREKNIKLIVDAEDNKNINKYRNIVNELCYNYNNDKINILKTYQMYRKDSLYELKYDICFFKNNYKYLGAKLVRGAYLHQEKTGSHLFTNKVDTDNNYNKGIHECYNNLNSSIIATHNNYSIKLAMKLAENSNSNKFIYANLLGMNEKYVKNLILENKDSKFATYIPYGPYSKMIPYLLRRLYENYDSAQYLMK